MTTTITGNETETPDTNTDTLSGGLTNGQIVNALFGNGLELNSAGEIVVKNAQQVGGQTAQDLLGDFSFSGRAFVGKGDGEILWTNTDASGTRENIVINPLHEYPGGTELDGDVSIIGTWKSPATSTSFEGPMVFDNTVSQPTGATLWQIRNQKPTPQLTIENGVGGTATVLNDTFKVGAERNPGANPRPSEGVEYTFGNTGVRFRGNGTGGVTGFDQNGNATVLF